MSAKETLARLGEIAERAEKASKGPWWRWTGHPRQIFSGETSVHTKTELRGHYVEVCAVAETENNRQDMRNAKFIAHSRDDVQALVETIKELLPHAEVHAHDDCWKDEKPDCDCLPCRAHKLLGDRSGT